MNKESKRAEKLLKSMVEGYGARLCPLEELFSLKLSPQDIERQGSPIPALGRYYDSVAFMENVTSARSIGGKRFMVLISYFIALSELMAGYTGKFRKISGRLTGAEIRYLKSLGVKPEEVKMAEVVERVSEHDTAAAGDYLKLRILYDHTAGDKRFLAGLCRNIEAFHFAATSEDVMSIVFGLIANELVYVRFMRKLMDFCDSMIGFVEKFPQLLVMPESTHDQFAEPTTYGKRVANTLAAISETIMGHLLEGRSFRVFSGKFNGGIGGFVTHCAAYPDVDWRTFSRKFVAGFGLHHEEMTFQCVPYAREAQIFRTIITLLDQVVKMLEDFIKLASAPAHFFQKEKRPGAKGSSLMPKVNLWQIEGAIVMLEKTQNALGFLAEKLPRFPHAGNMKRSFLLRDIGNDFMPAFIAFDRIIKEMSICVASPGNIEAAFAEYPGLAGSAMQTVLKRAGAPGDAYRIIQQAAVNQDGSYNNSKQFRLILKRRMDEMKLPRKLRAELLGLLDHKRLAEPGRQMALESLARLKRNFADYRDRTNRIKTF